MFFNELPIDTRIFDNPILLIGGLPRSGTTFCEKFIATHSKIHILDEFPLSNFPSAPRLLDEIGVFFRGKFEHWRNIKDDDLDDRIRALIVTVWALGSDPEKLRLAKDTRIIGQKTPGVENDLAWYHQFFRKGGIRLIYCVRNPLLVLRSITAMPWSNSSNLDLVIDYVLERYRQSLQSIAHAEDSLGVIVVPFCVDVFSEATPLERIEIGRALFDKLQLELSFEENMASYLQEMPIIDHWNVLTKARYTTLLQEELGGYSVQQVARFRSHPIIIEVIRRFGLKDVVCKN